MPAAKVLCLLPVSPERTANTGSEFYLPFSSAHCLPVAGRDRRCLISPLGEPASLLHLHRVGLIDAAWTCRSSVVPSRSAPYSQTTLNVSEENGSPAAANQSQISRCWNTMHNTGTTWCSCRRGSRRCTGCTCLKNASTLPTACLPMGTPVVQAFPSLCHTD